MPIADPEARRQAQREAMRRKRAKAVQDKPDIQDKPDKPAEPVDAQVAKAIRDAEAINQRLPQRTPTLSEDQYVQLGLAIDRYSRWRYRGYCAGVVASL